MEIYLTINLVNGKKYVGRDSKSDPKYLGSFLEKLQSNKIFTDDEILNIRILYSDGASATGLSKTYACSHHTILKIVRFIKPYNERRTTT